jgi:hypothetical protein
MPNKIPKTRAKKPRRPPDEVRVIELAKSKLKIRNLKDEIEKLKRSAQIRDLLVTRLEGMVKYLTKTAEGPDVRKN